MHARLDTRRERSRITLLSLALLLVASPSRAVAQSDVPLSVRRELAPAPGRPFRALADVALCRTFDCDRTASGALELAPTARLRIAGEGTTGRSMVRPASPISSDARVDLFYGTATRQLWIGRSTGQMHGYDSVGTAPDHWMEYGAAMRWRSVSIAVDLGSGSQTASAQRRPTAQTRINRWVDSLTGVMHEDTLTQYGSASTAYDRTRWRSTALRLGWQSDLWRLGVVLGRAGSQSERPVVWSTVEAERRLGRSLALVANVGSYPGSMAMDAPRSRWMLGAGLSVATGRLPRDERAPSSPAPAAERFVAILVAPARYRIVAHLADAERVELAADFTDWKPVTMQREIGDAWSVELPATTGVHRVSLRTDDGPWISPPGLAAQDDGFGGSAGVFVIP